MSDDATPPRLPPVDPATAGDHLGEAISPELLASLLADGDDELAAWVLGQALRDGSRTAVYDGLLADAMHLVGERWATGQWSVAEEHLASQTLLRALDRIRPDLGPDGRIGPLAVLAGVTGEHHMIGLVCLDHILQEQGWTVANLGADLPVSDLQRFLGRNDVRLLALSVSDPERIATAHAAVEAARAAAPTATVMLGGRLARSGDLAEWVGGDWAGASLAEAAAFADEALGRLSVGGR